MLKITKPVVLMAGLFTAMMCLLLIEQSSSSIFSPKKKKINPCLNIVTMNLTNTSSGGNRFRVTGLHLTRDTLLDANHNTQDSQEAMDLAKIVQNRLHYLQNPVDCSLARKLVCNMNRRAGLGSVLRDVTFCLHLAYATKRTLIIDSSRWNYAPHNFDLVFQPLSETCRDQSGQSSKNWEGDIEDIQVVILPETNTGIFPQPRPDFLPQAVPRDLAPNITQFHAYPYLWWQGQLLRYILRPGAKLKQFIDATQQRIKYSKPIVGVHIRRTDKNTEAEYYDIETYMAHVEDYYKRRSAQSGQPMLNKTIYLATDEPTILGELNQKYPDYTVVHNSQFSKAASMDCRHSEGSLYGIIADLYFLANSDYLVCTFSSNVGRRAYELMQTVQIDASAQAASLDVVYYMHGQQHEQHKAYEAHTEADHLEIRAGDTIRIFQNFDNGSSLGENVRTHQTGIFPSSLTMFKPMMIVADFADYSKADKLLRGKSLS